MFSIVTRMLRRAKRRRRLLINYASGKFVEKQKLNSSTALDIGGFDEVFNFCPTDIDISFRQNNHTILDSKRGDGYWLWKPYFIYEVLKIANPGDFVMYSDSGSYFINPVQLLVEQTNNSPSSMTLFDLEPHNTNGKWTKRDCFYYMGLNDCFRNDPQILASFVCMTKTGYALDFVWNWLQLSRNESIITDKPNICGLPNYDEFSDHRHDQSILSLLCRKQKIMPVADISQWGNGRDRNGLPQILQHTR